jgi:Zn-dependent protease with chaperone function
VTVDPPKTLDPTRAVDLDFERWLTERERRFDAHLVGGIPDYAFDLDWQMRRQLEALAPLRVLVQLLASGMSAFQRAIHELEGVAVGPHQLPQIHAMGVECAEKLGISIPQIYVVNQKTANAMTIPVGESDPIIIVHSALIELLEPGELKSVIGHECGHIHNRHGVYNLMWELFAQPTLFGVLIQVLGWMGPPGWVAKLMVQAFQGGARLLFQRWHRCAEITCDRAGAICSDDLATMSRALGKLSLGHLGHMEGFDADVFAGQMKIREKSWIAWVRELGRTHPPTALRVKASSLFHESDVLRTWRPDLQLGEAKRSKAEVDAEIGRFIL